MPAEYSVERVCEQLTTGPGLAIIPALFSRQDVEAARERIFLDKEPRSTHLVIQQTFTHSD